MISGTEDGYIHVYDYTRFKGENYSKLIFNVKQNYNRDGYMQDIDNQNERFCDSVLAHSDSVQVIEANPYVAK